MKRILLIAVPILLGLIVLILVVSGPQGVKLDDGSRVRFVSIGLGVEERPPVRIGFWQQLGGAVPGRFVDWLPNMMQASRSAGGSGWSIEVPDPTNVIQVVFLHELKDEVHADTRLTATIEDASGNTWHPASQSIAEISGPDRETVRVYSVRFAGYPRWEEQLDLQIRKDGTAGNERPLVAHFQLANPQLMNMPQQWQIDSIPAVRHAEDLSVRLERFEVAVEPENERLSSLSWIISTVEPGGTPPVSNAWHVAKAQVWDNFGNNALNGLPLKLPDDNTGHGHHWRVMLSLVAEEGSTVASNVFLNLGRTSFPDPGERITLFDGSTNQIGITIRAVNLIGAGEMKFSDGLLLTNSANLPSTPGLYRKGGRNLAPDGSMKRILTLQNSSPVLAVSVDSATESTWFSCRAETPDSDVSVWLDVRRPPQVGTPQFSRLVNDGQVVYYSMEKLDPDKQWEFTFGVHPIRQVEFFIDRPVESGQTLQNEKSPTGK